MKQEVEEDEFKCDDDDDDAGKNNGEMMWKNRTLMFVNRRWRNLCCLVVFQSSWTLYGKIVYGVFSDVIPVFFHCTI